MAGNYKIGSDVVVANDGVVTLTGTQKIYVTGNIYVIEGDADSNTGEAVGVFVNGSFTNTAPSVFDF
ncbi:MAG: hypothetical protein EBW90_11115 [Rhodobacteraceae bacterium]|jgi:hypothetical protein|nr:hypothetical protein [Paracoccaceae bacterium]